MPHSRGLLFGRSSAGGLPGPDRDIQDLKDNSPTMWYGAPRGIRIPVSTLKGWRPRPLDDGDSLHSLLYHEGIAIKRRT